MITFIIGYMCAGKTTYGKYMAKRLHRKFIDIDEEIEKQEGMPIDVLFRIKGENYFRNKETKFIESLESRKDEYLIVSTGGGAAIRNIKLMNKIGKTLYIKVNPETVLKRLKEGNNLEKRPLLKDVDETILLDKIKSEIEYREQYYLQAKIIVFGDETIENMCAQWA